MLMTAFILGGLVLLFFGGDLLVSGAVNIAKHLGMSELLIGITLVGFGTSTPELMTSILATFEGQPGIAVGNVVGSNIANIALILGIAALIYPLACDQKAFRRDGTFMVLATLLCLGVCLLGAMTLWMGFIFVAALITYIVTCIVLELKENKAALLGVETAGGSIIDSGAVQSQPETEQPQPPQKHLAFSFGQFVFGLILTFIGAKLLVDGSIDLARLFGISETIIGLTIVAIGTSMPELVASAMAAFRKNTDIAFGNIIGSNIYNILGILGITAILHPFEVPEQIMELDIWIMLGITALLMIFARWGWVISRWKGGVFLSLYAAYLLLLVLIATKAV
jgi:cation:H+ antiporter